MTERSAIRAQEGRPSRPLVHLGLIKARVFSHHAGVVGESDRRDTDEEVVTW